MDPHPRAAPASAEHPGAFLAAWSGAELAETMAQSARQAWAAHVEELADDGPRSALAQVRLARRVTTWAWALRTALDAGFTGLVQTRSHPAVTTTTHLRWRMPLHTTPEGFARTRTRLSFLPGYDLQRLEDLQPFTCSRGPAWDPLRWLDQLARTDPSRRVLIHTSTLAGQRTTRPDIHPWPGHPDSTRQPLFDRLQLITDTTTTALSQLERDAVTIRGRHARPGDRTARQT